MPAQNERFPEWRPSHVDFDFDLDFQELPMTFSPRPGPGLDAICGEDSAALGAALSASPVAADLDIRFTETSSGRAVAVLPASERLVNFLGYIHTGALFTLAEQVLAAAANSLGYVGLPLNCEVHFLAGADPTVETTARARVVDTQGRIARLSAEVEQGDEVILRVTEMVFLRSADRTEG